MQFARQNVNPARLARAIEVLKPVYLDTETTGLTAKDQVIELAVIDYDGTVLINDLMTPTCPISEGAARTHGITAEMLDGKMPLREWWSTIGKLLSGRFVVAYNATFDLRMLYQTASEQGIEVPSISFMGVFDMMQIFSTWANVPGKFGHLKWFRLSDAAYRLGVAPNGDLHRALADTDFTRRLTLAMSAQFVNEKEVVTEASTF